MTSTITETAVEPAPVRLGYQPALDGVRAVAITLVVLYHYPWGTRLVGVNPVHGAFLGVDAFFVLSGFLITTLLLQEQARFRRIHIRRFYARRALRLFPAFAVLWLIALALHFRVASTNSLHASWLGLGGALFYVGNWVLIFRGIHTLGPIQQTWSLAVEEQFYLVWPALLILALRKGLSLRTIATITAAGALAAALGRALYWRGALTHANFTFYYFQLTGRPDPSVHSFQGSGGRLFTTDTANHINAVWNRIYYGSDTQADALLAGCFAAIVLFWLLPRLDARARLRLSIASYVALGIGTLIVWNAYSKFANWLPQWGFLVFAVSIAVLIVGLVVAPRAPLARVFALAPMAWLGRRSYAIYLFHELLFSQLHRRRVHLSPQVSFVFQIAMILLAAELCYRLVEAPMLRLKRHFQD